MMTELASFVTLGISQDFTITKAADNVHHVVKEQVGWKKYYGESKTVKVAKKTSNYYGAFRQKLKEIQFVL